MNVIEVDSLNVSMAGLPILKEISFAIPQGITVGLLGANGSGKSTLVRAILGLTPHQHGTISLLGTPPGRFRSWEKIGYVPQRASVSLHSTTVAEVVASGTLANRPIGWTGRKTRTRITEALNKVGLPGHTHELYAHLSGGQQQRVLIARAIVNQPQLLIMDEPFAGVDLTAQAEIAATLKNLAATILVVLHETEALADQIDRVLTLREGRLVYDGPAAPLTTHGTHEAAPPPSRHTWLTGMERPWIS